MAGRFGGSADRMTDATTASATTATRGEILPGLVFALRFQADGTVEELAVDQPIAHRAEGWLWLHFNLADGRACQFLRSTRYFPMPVRELLVSADEHQQLQANEDCLYGIVADLVCGLHGATEEIGFFHFAMTETLLVSGRRHMLSAVEATRKELRKGRKIPTPAGLLDALLEHVADAVDRHAEDLAGKLDHIEERILADDMSEGRQLLGRIRRITVRLHRQLSILRSLMQRFELDRGHVCKLALRPATARLSQRLDWLDTEIVALRDRAHLLQEEVAIKTAEQTNRNLHVLAVVTTLLLPATLITGLFGMNVGGLPLVQNAHGFFWSVVLLAGVSGIVFWLLRRSGILRR
jgi:zinc transporter